jgi:hypothetical protein
MQRHPQADSSTWTPCKGHKSHHDGRHIVEWRNESGKLTFWGCECRDHAEWLAERYRMRGVADAIAREQSAAEVRAVVVSMSPELAKLFS